MAGELIKWHFFSSSRCVLLCSERERKTLNKTRRRDSRRKQQDEVRNLLIQPRLINFEMKKLREKKII